MVLAIRLGSSARIRIVCPIAQGAAVRIQAAARGYFARRVCALLSTASGISAGSHDACAPRALEAEDRWGDLAPVGASCNQPRVSVLNPDAAAFVPRGMAQSLPNISMAGVASTVAAQVSTAVCAEVGALMGAFMCRMAASRRSGGRQRRAERVRRRNVRQLGCVHGAFVGDEQSVRRFHAAASSCGVVVGMDASDSESEYFSADDA